MLLGFFSATRQEEDEHEKHEPDREDQIGFFWASHQIMYSRVIGPITNPEAVDQIRVDGRRAGCS